MTKKELNNYNIIRTEELTTAFFEYYRKRKEGPNEGSEFSYGTYFYALRFWAIDDILKYWNVAKNNNKYYETFDPENFNINENIEPKAFADWRKDSYTECSERDYHLCDYYRQYIYKKNPKNDTNKTGVKNDKPGYNYLRYVAGFLCVNDMIYALSIIDIVMGIIQKALERNRQIKNNQNALDEKDRKKLVESRGALALMREWIEFGNNEEVDGKKSLIFTQNVCEADEEYPVSKKDLDELRSNIEPKLIYKIDGAIALVKEIGIDSFIQYAIEQSYFFKPNVVINRMTYIAETFVKRHENDEFEGKLYDLYARSSKKVASDDFFHEQEYEKDDNLQQEADYGQELVVNKEEQKNRRAKEVIERKENGLPALRKNSKLDKYAVFKDKKYPVDNYPIIIDNDGNAAVRSLIKNETGYTVSAGKSDIFQNYKISHIWGRAYDPRFFTNLWNIVLVPAWANDLLDKNAVEGTLESKLKSTIMSICKVLYLKKIDEKQWNDLNLPIPSVINKGKDVVKPTFKVIGVEPKKRIPEEGVPNSDVPYLINIIEGKGNNTLGDIVKYAVYI